MRNLLLSVYLLLAIMLLVCVLYPICIWSIGNFVWPFQANGSMIKDLDGKIVGSKLIAQEFHSEKYFIPRPSAADYNASASKSSALAPSNYALRNRVARAIGLNATYFDGAAVGNDIDTWFANNIFAGRDNIVDQWVTMYPELAKAWVNANAAHTAYVEQWAALHPEIIEQYIIDHMQMLVPTVADLAVPFFKSFARQYPGKFPLVTASYGAKNEMQLNVEAVDSGPEVRATFFDMWRAEYKDLRLKNIQADMLTTSASGLDPHITLKNAMQQADRVARALALETARNVDELRPEIKQIILEHAQAPLWGLLGEDLVNVLEVNLTIKHRYIDAKL